MEAWRAGERHPVPRRRHRRLRHARRRCLDGRRGWPRRDGVVEWRRFASGLHEPLTLAIRDEQIHVFDRNGVWRLRDTNGDGEADRHELFSNAFAQTADMREFPSTIRLGPNGEFVIAKGGQEATTIGKHNGSVLRLSADGRCRDRARLRIAAAAAGRAPADRPRHVLAISRGTTSRARRCTSCATGSSTGSSATCCRRRSTRRRSRPR